MTDFTKAFQIQQWQPGFLENVALRILRAGEIPKHIGIVMDGNRRWAKERNIKAIDGHIEGELVLEKVGQFAEALGVKEITAYALSTDNLKRSKEEVKALFDLCAVTSKKQLSQMDAFRKKGIKVHVMGDIEMLPKKIRSLAAKSMLMTMDHDKTRLNLAVVYTSTEEIDRAMNILRKAVKNGEILIDDIDESLVEKCLYTNKSYPVDFFIRTSGEQRFSDFFLWQANNVPLYFSDVLWPDFKFFNFFKAIINYQRSLPRIQVNNLKHRALAYEHVNPEQQKAKDERIVKFLDNEEQKFILMLEKMALDAHQYL